MTGYRISEVGERTGFAPSTLRYYEDIGLIPEPERATSGYRVYGEGHVELLTFIGRAKRLGLSLEEIDELATAWRTGDCPRTRGQLERMLAAKLHEVGRRVEELSAFRAQLDVFYRDLTGRRPPDRCGPSCGCAPEEGEVIGPPPTEPLTGAHDRDG